MVTKVFNSQIISIPRASKYAVVVRLPSFVSSHNKGSSVTKFNLSDLRDFLLAVAQE